LRAAQKTLEDEEKDYIDLLEARYGNILSREDIYKPLKEQTGREDRLIPDAVKDAYRALLDTKSDFDIASAQAAKAIADAENSVAQAQDTLRNARKDLADTLKGTEAIDIEIKELQVESARIALREAEADLAKIKEGPGSRNVQLKQIQLDNARLSLLKAQEELADMKAGPDPLDIELREIQVSNAQIALADARAKLEKATLIAPFDGLVASVNNKVGDRVVGGATIIQIIGPGEFEVEAILDELDVYQIRPGQAVQVSLDALPRARLEGRVKAISPLAQREAGVISYKAIISLQPPGRITLKDGLTASAEIMVARRQNVLLVPSRAVSRRGRDGIVRVMVDGQPQERIVRTGLSQDGQTEILSGLSEREKVLMPVTTSSQLQAPSGQPRRGGFFGPGGGRRGPGGGLH
jgi:RND family efflux transporter MFP subunit